MPLMKLLAEFMLRFEFTHDCFAPKRVSTQKVYSTGLKYEYRDRDALSELNSAQVATNQKNGNTKIINSEHNKQKLETPRSYLQKKGMKWQQKSQNGQQCKNRDAAMATTPKEREHD